MELEVASGAAARNTALAVVAGFDRSARRRRNVMRDPAVRVEPVGIALGALRRSGIDRDQLAGALLRRTATCVAPPDRDLIPRACDRAAEHGVTHRGDKLVVLDEMPALVR